MSNKNAQTTLASIGEAQIAAAEGMSEMGRELARLIGRLFRR